MSHPRSYADAFSDWVEDHSGKLLLALSFLFVVVYTSTVGLDLDSDYPVLDTIGVLVLTTGAMCLVFLLPYYVVLFATVFVLGIVDTIRGAD